MGYKKKAQAYKKQFGHLFIPHLKVVHDGKELPVVSTAQCHYEWMLEYGRAELLRKVSIVELIIIILLVARCIHERF